MRRPNGTDDHGTGATIAWQERCLLDNKTRRQPHDTLGYLLVYALQLVHRGWTPSRWDVVSAFRVRWEDTKYVPPRPKIRAPKVAP